MLPLRNLKPVCKLAPAILNIRYVSARLNEVFIESFNDKGKITLNRPEKLNILNMSMINQIYPVLKQWESSKTLVIIKGAGDKAFCAGGDAKTCAESELRGEQYAKRFYLLEFSMNALIGQYKIPFIALMDGIVMGDGAGISIHGRYRVATERCIFAMPEVSIGFVPDVGASYFLSRLKGELGRYLGMTGHQLVGRDVQRATLATHYCESRDLSQLEEELMKCDNDKQVLNILDKFQTEDTGVFKLEPVLKKIDSCFSAPTVELVLAKLLEDDSDWAKETIDVLQQMSPMSLKVTHEMISRGKTMSLAECLEMEYQIAQTAVSHKDLYEGIRAVIVDKDNKPVWRPAKLTDVTPELVQSFFPKARKKMIIY